MTNRHQIVLKPAVMARFFTNFDKKNEHKNILSLY